MNTNPELLMFLNADNVNGTLERNGTNLWPQLVLQFVPLLAIIVFAIVSNRKKAITKATQQWAEAHALRLTAGNQPFVEHYVRTGRRLRWICMFGGLVLPPLVRNAFDPATQYRWPFSLVGLLAGYLVGTLWAELALTRADAGVTAARLQARRLEDYLPKTLRRALRIVGPLTAALWALALFSSRSASPSARTRTISVLEAIGWGLAALTVSVTVEAVQRWILARPQPLAAEDLLAADDAVRSQSLHTLGGTGVAILLVWAAVPLSRLAANTGVLVSLFFGLATTGSLLGALIFWRYWCHRAWRVQNRIEPLSKVAIS